MSTVCLGFIVDPVLPDPRRVRAAPRYGPSASEGHRGGTRGKPSTWTDHRIRWRRPRPPSPTRRRSSSTRRAGPRPSITTNAELDALVNRLAHGLRDDRGRPASAWCGAGRTRSRCSPRIHAARKLRARGGAAVVPLQRRGDGLRHRQLRRDLRDRRRRVRRASSPTRPPRARRSAPGSRTRPPTTAPDPPAGFRSWDEVLAGQSDRPRRTVDGRRVRGGR